MKPHQPGEPLGYLPVKPDPRTPPKVRYTRERLTADLLCLGAFLCLVGRGFYPIWLIRISHEFVISDSDLYELATMWGLGLGAGIHALRFGSKPTRFAAGLVIVILLAEIGWDIYRCMI